MRPDGSTTLDTFNSLEEILDLDSIPSADDVLAVARMDRAARERLSRDIEVAGNRFWVQSVSEDRATSLAGKLQVRGAVITAMAHHQELNGRQAIAGELVRAVSRDTNEGELAAGALTYQMLQLTDAGMAQFANGYKTLLGRTDPEELAARPTTDRPAVEVGMATMLVIAMRTDSPIINQQLSGYDGRYEDELVDTILRSLLVRD